MSTITIPFRSIVISSMVFGGSLATGIAQDNETLEKNPAQPTREQAVAVLRKTISTAEGAGHVKSALKYFHRAPNWDNRMLEKRAEMFLDCFFYNGKGDTSAIEELGRDGIWGPASDLIDKDRLRRRVVWHRVKTDDCYALALKDGSTEAVFHLEGANLTILHYEFAGKRKTIQGFLKDMLEENQSGDPSGTALSFGILGNLGPDAEAVIPELTKLLTNKDVQRRMMAALTLWEIDRRAERSLPPIIAGLTDKKMSVSDRTMAATCLWAIGPDAKSAAPALTAAMAEGDLSFRMICAAALWRVGGDTDVAIPVLLDIMKGDDRYISSGAERTLAGIISTLLEDPARKAAADQLIGQILEISKSKELRHRRAAFNVLARIGGDSPAVIGALKKAIQDKDGGMGGSVISALVEHNSSLLDMGQEAEISVPLLIVILTDKESSARTRIEVVKCLTVIGPDAGSAAPALTAGIGEDNVELRTACAAALWKIAGDTDTTTPVLLESLQDKGSYDTIWMLSEMILTLQEDPARKAVADQLTRQILEISSSKEEDVRRAAIEVLARIAALGEDNPEVIEALKKVIKDENIKDTNPIDASFRYRVTRAFELYKRKLKREGRKVVDDPEMPASETNSKKAPIPIGSPLGGEATNPYAAPDGNKPYVPSDSQ